MSYLYLQSPREVSIIVKTQDFSFFYRNNLAIILFYLLNEYKNLEGPNHQTREKKKMSHNR